MTNLNMDETIRFDVFDDEVPDEIVHAQPLQDSDTVDLDLDAPAEPLILARRVRYHWQYVAGLSRTGRVLFTTDSRLARVFDSEDAIITTIFQFQGTDEDLLVLKDMFKDLNLEMKPAPKVLEMGL